MFLFFFINVKNVFQQKASILFYGICIFYYVLISPKKINLEPVVSTERTSPDVFFLN